MKISLKEYYRLQNDPSRKKEYKKVLKQLSNTTDSQSLFFKSIDAMDPKRQSLHKKIIEDYLSSYQPPRESPTIHIITGSIGSGKTSVKDTVVENKEQESFMFINFDDVKRKLPEYEILKDVNPKKAAQFVQSESAKLAGKLFKRAVQKGLNIIFEKNIVAKEDGTLQIKSDLKKVLNKKYTTIIHVVFLDTFEEAWKRVQTRYEAIRRYAPKDKVKKTFQNLFPNLNKLMKADIKKTYLLFFWYNGQNTDKVKLVGLSAMNIKLLKEAFRDIVNSKIKNSSYTNLDNNNTLIHFTSPLEYLGEFLTNLKDDPKEHLNGIFIKTWKLLPNPPKKHFQKLDFFKKICE